ncbi:hypothetical protein BJ741DRAFT_74232 [Chytriomyces cf. hyalinus JEL632]|nr:hypothetical protein BJ741DRAFT_74232 [Chytriomyces cf. hyalinus JEL632]
MQCTLMSLFGIWSNGIMTSFSTLHLLSFLSRFFVGPAVAVGWTLVTDWRDSLFFGFIGKGRAVISISCTFVLKRSACPRVGHYVLLLFYTILWRVSLGQVSNAACSLSVGGRALQLGC